MAETIISRAQAKAAGLKKYFTGIPCKNGHVSVRYVVGSNCLECVEARNALPPEKAAVRKAKASARQKANRAAANARNRKYREANREEIRKKSRAYTRAYAEKMKASGYSWAKANPEKARAIVRNRRARIKKAEGRHTALDIQNILDAQKGKCALCKAKVGKNYHVDHIHPVSKGGSNDRANLQVLCGPCNRSKGSKDPIEFARERGLLL